MNVRKECRLSRVGNVTVKPLVNKKFNFFFQVYEKPFVAAHDFQDCSVTDLQDRRR